MVKRRLSCLVHYSVKAAIFRSSARNDLMPAWSCVCVCVCVSVCQSVNILVYTFLSVCIFLIQQLIRFIFGMHVWCTLGPGLYSPNVFGDAALINYANLCKICKSVDILVYTFLHIGIGVSISGYFCARVPVLIFGRVPGTRDLPTIQKIGSKKWNQSRKVIRGVHSPHGNYAHLCKLRQITYTRDYFMNFSTDSPINLQNTDR